MPFLFLLNKFPKKRQNNRGKTKKIKKIMNKLLLIFIGLMFFTVASQAQITRNEAEMFLSKSALKSVKKVAIIYNSTQFKLNNVWQAGEYDYNKINSLSVSYHEKSMVFEVNKRKYLIPYRAIKFIKFRKASKGEELTIELFN
ncbi:hypothetical protein BKI52_34370 [marine bacterium AO1-C]|nr:hypothetical protein BKI52_34370 [marine bacterium AO1-C]